MASNSLPPKNLFHQVLSYPIWGGISIIVSLILSFISLYISEDDIRYLLLIGLVVFLLSVIGGYFYAAQRKVWSYSIAMFSIIIFLYVLISMYNNQIQSLQSQDSLGSLVLAISSFEDNWIITEGGKEPEHNSTGGDTGGYIKGQEIIGSNIPDWFYHAPLKFLGDKTEMYNGILLFALTQTNATNAITSTDDIILIGESMTLTFDIRNPGQEWSQYAILINENAGWKKEDLTPPNSQEMHKVLSSLKALRIRGEYRKGDDTSGLDNVIIMKHP